DLQIAPDRIPRLDAYDGIPVDTSDWAVERYSGPKQEAAVAAAIHAANPRTILVLPAGTYAGTLSIRRSDVVVRGDCADRSRVVWSHRGTPNNPVFSNAMCSAGPNRGQFCAADGDCPGSGCDHSVRGTICNPGWLQLCAGMQGDHLPDVISEPHAWSGPHTRGAETLKIAGAQSFAPGDIVWIASDVLPGPDEKAMTDDLNYMAKVVAVGDGSITLDRGLPIDFSPNGARVQRWEQVVRNVGVECLTLRDEAPADPAGLYQSVNLSIRGAFDSWIYDVDLGDSFNTLARVERSARVVLLGNRCGEQHKSARGDGRSCGGAVADNPCWNKQAIVFDEAHDNSFIDNVVHSSIGVELSNSASRNWIAYNYFPKPRLHPAGESRRALFPHGNYAHSNVLEGNVLWGVGEMDTHWGSQGPRYAWFRNVAVGPVARFSNEAPKHGGDRFVCSRDASYILNRASRFGTADGQRIDARSQGLHLERNVFTIDLAHDDTTAKGTVAIDNAKAATGTPPPWASTRLPDTLNPRLGGQAPAFWCSNTVRNGGPVCEFTVADGGVGALWDGRCILPAQARAQQQCQ
ncbi:MAG: hypothetical protein K0V04_33140, partial [Deltaproteobacteria bacterium]|nr:hypothetical protein [Deltaproteobacteria bacterium]